MDPGFQVQKSKCGTKDSGMLVGNICFKTREAALIVPCLRSTL